ncbi:MAG: hypothetical protein PWQ56_289 [Patescibacteria group bacterium]|nr:MAG: hypothetical protein XD75_0308 [Parcubacteria bacterium 33_209]MDK2949124.1 hypothetical protein [Patescibacteria group bacterium]
MAKVFSHGGLWPFKREAWYGKIITCSRCGCRFELDENSEFQQFTGGIRQGLSYARCPECDNTGNSPAWRDVKK